eukprot:s1918_g8.t1
MAKGPELDWGDEGSSSATASCSIPVDAEETASVAADEIPTNTGPEEPVLPDMAAAETVAAEADMLQTEVGRQETSQEEDVQKCDSAAATSSATHVRHALIQGSRGHPFLCARPCVRLAKGNCYMGDACGTHPRFTALDKRQRLQVHNMDKSTFLWTLLPHIRRSFADARIEATELLEIIEREVDAQQVYHRDRQLDRTLRQMPLSALLACIVARETNFQSLLQEQITQLRQRLP